MIIKINTKLIFDFQDYTSGDDFEFGMQFFSDDKYTVPQDVSSWLFFMDILPAHNHGCATPTKETLSIGAGITYGPGANTISFSKKLVSASGKYIQSIRSVEPSGRTLTREEGKLTIDPKI